MIISVPECYIEDAAAADPLLPTCLRKVKKFNHNQKTVFFQVCIT